MPCQMLAFTAIAAGSMRRRSIRRSATVDRVLANALRRAVVKHSEDLSPLQRAARPAGETDRYEDSWGELPRGYGELGRWPRLTHPCCEIVITERVPNAKAATDLPEAVDSGCRKKERRRTRSARRSAGVRLVVSQPVLCQTCNSR